MTQSGLRGRLAVIAFLAGLYFVAAKLGLSMAFVHPSATAVWPPTGIALAAFLVLGYRVWPGIFLGAFLANLTTAGSVATTFGIATGNTLEGLVGAYLVNRFAHGSHTFDHPQDVFKFAALAAMVSTTVSATFGVTSLALGGYANWADYGRIWLTWWLGDAGGALIVTPVLLLWSQNARLRLTLAQVKEAGLLLVALLLAGQAVFGGVFPITTNIYPLAFLCVPILVWTAFRLSPRETATATLLLSGIAIWGTWHGFGPFVRDPRNESLLLLQAFLGVSVMIALTLAAAVLERKRVEDALRSAQEELEQRVQERTTALRSAVDLLKNEVNERTQTENALRASEERFRAFMDNSPAAAFMKDEEGRYTYVNKLIEHRFNSKASDWLGKTDYDLWPAEIAKQFREHDRAVLAQNKTMELYETAPDARGDQSHWLSLKFPVKDSAGRRFLGGVSLDITDRKRAEEALRESQERFRSAFGSAAIGMALVAPDGRWLQVNRSLCEIVGYSEQELLGANFQAITHPDDLEVDLEYVRQMLAGEIQTYKMEKRYFHKLGQIIWVLLSVSLVRDAQENPMYFISQNQDITERKLAEGALQKSESQLRQAQKVESIGQLAGGIAHDFNNLLTVINSYSDMLLSEIHDHSPLHHGLAEIKEAGQRAATLTQQLLAFSGQQILKPKVLDLNAVVQNIMKLVRRLIDEDINLSICPTPNLGRVKVDPGQIEQVIINLAVNARDAMPQGGQLRIETTNVELDGPSSGNQSAMPPGPYVMLAVSDTGCGMDAGTQARIFEPFFTTKAVGKGTGLGLSTVYGIVEQSSGHIDVSSKVGNGSTFRI
ncbi:MAG: PAS domain S-box protein [Nitrospirae bacterium]|nr:MAG: PAS domain S-box protein [Nitrospirota bacterium]